MLYQLLSGRLPHESSSMGTLLRQIAQDAAPDVRSVRAELPAPLADVVALALQKRAAYRYADGLQMAADLRAVAKLMDRPPAPRTRREVVADVQLPHPHAKPHSDFAATNPLA
jgi:eukaryotic-like serine/threonine-protein kinase